MASNSRKWKRRPKGKRGWRKIVVDPHISKEDAIQNQPQNDLFYIDKGPRRLSKRDIRHQALQKLQESGHIIDPSTAQEDSANEESNKISPHQWYLQTLKPKKNTNRVKPIRKKRKIKKKSQSNASARRDLWGNADSSSDEDTIENEEESSEDDRPISDRFGKPFIEANARDIIEQQKKACKGFMTSQAAVFNRHVPKKIGISLPDPGESVNPLPSEYIALKKRITKHDKKFQFKSQWTDKRTLNWYNEVVLKKPASVAHLQNVPKFKKFEKKWKPFTEEYKKLKKDAKLKNKKLQKNARIRRGNPMISRLQRSTDFVFNKKKRGKIYGSDYIMHQTSPHIIHSSKVGRNQLRTNVTSKVENKNHPLSNVLYELKAQNKIEGYKKKGYKFRKRPFYGPRFKVSSRIGTVHHSNANSRLFRGFM